MKRWTSFLLVNAIFIGRNSLIVAAQATATLDCNFDAEKFCSWQNAISGVEDDFDWNVGSEVPVDGWHSIPRSLTGAGYFAYTQGQLRLENAFEGSRAWLRSAVIDSLPVIGYLSFIYWKAAAPPVLQICLKVAGDPVLQCLDTLSGLGQASWVKRVVTIPPSVLPFQIIFAASGFRSALDTLAIDDVTFTQGNSDSPTNSLLSALEGSDLQKLARNGNTVNFDSPSHDGAYFYGNSRYYASATANETDFSRFFDEINSFSDPITGFSDPIADFSQPKTGFSDLSNLTTNSAEDMIGPSAKGFARYTARHRKQGEGATGGSAEEKVGTSRLATADAASTFESSISQAIASFVNETRVFGLSAPSFSSAALGFQSGARNSGAKKNFKSSFENKLEAPSLVPPVELPRIWRHKLTNGVAPPSAVPPVRDCDEITCDFDEDFCDWYNDPAAPSQWQHRTPRNQSTAIPRQDDAINGRTSYIWFTSASPATRVTLTSGRLVVPAAAFLEMSVLFTSEAGQLSVFRNDAANPTNIAFQVHENRGIGARSWQRVRGPLPPTEVPIPIVIVGEQLPVGEYIGVDDIKLVGSNGAEISCGAVVETYAEGKQTVVLTRIPASRNGFFLKDDQPLDLGSRHAPLNFVDPKYADHPSIPSAFLVPSSPQGTSATRGIPRQQQFIPDPILPTPPSFLGPAPKGNNLAVFGPAFSNSKTHPTFVESNNQRSPVSEKSGLSSSTKIDYSQTRKPGFRLALPQSRAHNAPASSYPWRHINSPNLETAGAININATNTSATNSDAASGNFSPESHRIVQKKEVEIRSSRNRLEPRQFNAPVRLADVPFPVKLKSGAKSRELILTSKEGHALTRAYLRRVPSEPNLLLNGYLSEINNNLSEIITQRTGKDSTTATIITTTATTAETTTNNANLLNAFTDLMKLLFG